ncbi:hypothetical protein KR018_005523 [Drosophila ironensis]|nr:hypothetical protein KR018_005523 [Drosophila ironensis]
MKVPRTPDWVGDLSVDHAVRNMLEGGDRILAVLPSVHLIQFRNCTLLLPIRVKVQLKDMSVQKVGFLLKAQHGSDFQSKIMSQLKLFMREHHMYHNVLPRFEQLYRNAGHNITFAPKAFKLDYPIGKHYVLLENIKSQGYQNASRAEGLGLKCLKPVLKKMAQFHAASVAYVEKYGPFHKLLTQGVYTLNNRLILQELSDPDAFLSQLRRLRVGERFYKRFVAKEQGLVDKVLNMHAPNSQQFNVLNHGDLWVNNLMFQYDEIGNVKDTMFLDFQTAKYGSPANDLYYTILSSANREIKLSKFDNLIQYYFYFLLDSLKTLQYEGPMPSLQTIREELNKNGLAAYMVVSRVLPIAIMNQFEDEVNDDYASKMKCSMFTNRKYIQAVNDILPWLDERSLLD